MIVNLQRLNQVKIINFKELLRISKKARKENKKIVFTNGCFDLFHIGHVYSLEEARKYGDILIAGLNSDSSVKKWKDKSRPIIREKQRAKLLLPYVDYVYIFPGYSPMNVLKAINPEVYVKGGDYKRDTEDKGNCRRYVRSYGGKVIIVPLVRNISTTSIIKKIKNRKKKITKKNRVIYLAGVWDLFHIGHTRILEKAKTLGDFLVVGINTDLYTKNYKGRKPVIPYRQRKEIIKFTKCADKIIPHVAWNEVEMLDKYKVDILAIGQDWEKYHSKKIVRDYCKKKGIKIIQLPHTNGITSTLIKNKIKNL